MTPRSTTSPPHDTGSARAEVGLDVPRVLGERLGPPTGPTLLCTGGVHGNEPAGVLGLLAVLETLEREDVPLEGSFVALVGNRAALRQGVRYVRDDLNRAWSDAHLERLAGTPADSLQDEDRELEELRAELLPRIDRAQGPVCFLDLHSTSGPGKPFVTMDDTLRNRGFAEAFPVPRVLGLEEELVGTLTGHVIIHHPMPAIGFECGRHEDEITRRHAEAAVWIALEASGVLAPSSRPEPEAGRRLLRDAVGDLAAVVEVRHRHEARVDFVMEPGWSSFQAVRRDEVLATEGGDVVRSPLTGLMLMPRYQGQGSDGYFIVRTVNPFWLRLSTFLRRARAERWVHLLPGVRRHPERPNSFLVDKHRARWLVRQVFHLLGFRREPGSDTEAPVMTPRDGARRR